MRFVKNSPKGTELKVQEMVRPSDGKTIVLMGAMHAASRESWEDLTEVLRAYQSEDYEVHFEGVHPGHPVTDYEKTRVDIMQNLMNVGRKAAESTGLVYQKDALAHFSGALNYDLDIVTIARGLSDKAVKLLGGIPLDEIKITPSRMLWSLKHMSWIINISKFLPSTRSILGKAIVDDRNKYAISRALESEHDVVLFWGALHLDGMRKLLRQNGFVDGTASWRIVIPRDYEISDSRSEQHIAVSV